MFDFRHNRVRLIAAALMYGGALPIGGVMRQAPRGPEPGVAPKLPKTTLHSRNGGRECQRRQRQIARGALRAENGLR